MDNPVPISESTATTDDVLIFCHVNEVPAWVDAELTRIYGNYRSSLPFFHVYLEATSGISTYVARQGGRPITILLFRLENGVVHVLNEMIPIVESEIACFADYVFANFDTVWAIRFRAIHTDVRRLFFPFQKHNSQERFPVALPATPEEYTNRLGKSTREIIQRYRKRITRDFPSFRSEFYVKEEIDERDLHALIDLSETRILSKKKRFGIDDAERQRIIKLARLYGLVHIIRIDGRVCAGTINFQVGPNYYLEVIAHDLTLNDYRLGTVCSYLTLCACIERGGIKYDFGGGWNFYKIKFLGVQQDMDCVEIYRSRKDMLLKSHRIAKTAIDGYMRRLKVWLLMHEKSVVTRLVLSAVYLLNGARRRSG